MALNSPAYTDPEDKKNWTIETTETIKENILDRFPDSWEIDGFSTDTRSLSSHASMRVSSTRSTVAFITKGLKINIKIHGSKTKEITVDVRDNATGKCRIIYKREYQGFDSFAERLINQITCCLYVLKS